MRRPNTRAPVSSRRRRSAPRTPEAGPSQTPDRFQRIRAAGAAAGVALGLLAIWVGLAFASPHFLTFNNITNILLQASVLAIIASGQTYALVSAEIDLSVGSVVALAGSLAAVLMILFGVPWGVATVAGILVGVATGMVNGLFRVRFGIPSFVTSLAMLGMARGLALVITDGRSVYGLPRGFLYIGQGRLAGIPVPIFIAAAVLLVFHLLLTKTRFGLNIYAVGGNAEAARLSGVNVSRVRFAVLTMSGCAAGLGGVILASRLAAGTGTVGEALLLDSIAAVVIGGTSLMGGVGTIGGTAIGVLLIASIRNGLVLLGVSAFWQLVAIGALILFAVFLDYLSKGSAVR